MIITEIHGSAKCPYGPYYGIGYCTPVCSVSSLVYHKCPRSSRLSPLMCLKCPPACRQGVLADVSFELSTGADRGQRSRGKVEHDPEVAPSIFFSLV